MGVCSYKEPSVNITTFNENNENGFIIWIDENVNNEENIINLTKLRKGNFKIETYEDIESGLNILLNKDKYFKNIYLILGESFYIDFILKFKNNLMNIFVVPKIVILIKNEKLFKEKNSNIKDIFDNKFYNLGGIQTIFNKAVRDLISEKIWKKKYEIENKTINNDIKREQYIFEKINNKLELYLPVFYKALIKLNKNDIFAQLTHYLYVTYKKNKNDKDEENKITVKDLLEPIDGIPEIPIEILCKYYARLYTIESDFYKDLNKSLREENLQLKVEELLFSANKNNYYSITFIKSFYEGIKLHCFKFDLKDKLYRFSYITQKEIDEINKYLRDKKPGISSANLFSKAFLSFSEDERVANNFYENYKKNKSKYENKNIFPVFFHLIQKEDIKESLYTHIKIDNISVYPSENEILFLPFTCFEILKVIPIEETANERTRGIHNRRNVEKYIIELTYLGQYEKELKNIEKEEIIPDTKFKLSIEESNLIKFNQDITNKRVIDEFNEYEKSFRKNNKDIYIIYEVNDKDIDENHYVSIFGRNLEENGTDFVKENRDKIKILIKLLILKHNFRKFL